MYRLLKTIKITQIIVEKGIRGRTCHAIHRYATANNENIRNHTKTTIIICYVLRCKTSIWMGNILKSPLDHFK